ncbi:MAG: hypothetical protein AAF438_23870 [Pseudomonadota bacterium]
MKYIAVVAVLLSLAALVWLNREGEPTQSPEIPGATPAETVVDTRPSDTDPVVTSPSIATPVEVTPATPDPTPIVWTPEAFGYGDTTAYDAYSEQALIALMEDNGDPLAATAFVNRLEAQGEYGTIVHMSYLYRLVGSTAAINKMLTWEDFEWGDANQALELAMFAQRLGDTQTVVSTEGFTEEEVREACSNATQSFDQENQQRLERGWQEFPSPSIVSDCP